MVCGNLVLAKVGDCLYQPSSGANGDSKAAAE
jgi:hypothetical protein